MRTHPILAPIETIPVTPESVTNGPPLKPIDRIYLYSADEWEEFVRELCDGIKGRYGRTERWGGSGDMGVDVVVYPNQDDNNTWKCFQCKHYDHPLTPSDVWVEVGKIMYYSFMREYTPPQQYSFVAPHGVGNKLNKLLKNPDKLKNVLLENWVSYCQDKITSTEPIKLEGIFPGCIDQFDFSIFDYIPPHDIIDLLRQTRNHVARFGNNLPPREDAPEPPEKPEETEMIYLGKLFDAYEDHLNKDVRQIDDLADHPDMKGHYHDSVNYCVFRVNGHSMEPNIHHGDIVVIHYNYGWMSLDGKVCAVRTDDGITLKKVQLVPKNKQVLLLPFNQDYNVTVFDEGSPIDVHLVGVVVIQFRLY